MARWTVLVYHRRNEGKQAGGCGRSTPPPPSKTPSISSRSLTKQAHREGAGGLPFLPPMVALALLHILGVAEALYGTQVPTTHDTLGMCRLSVTSLGTLSADPKVGEAREYWPGTTRFTPVVDSAFGWDRQMLPRSQSRPATAASALAGLVFF